MKEPVVAWRWYIVDERTGKRRLTKWHMPETDALERYPDAEREPSSPSGASQSGQRRRDRHEGLVIQPRSVIKTSRSGSISIEIPYSATAAETDGCPPFFPSQGLARGDLPNDHRPPHVHVIGTEAHARFELLCDLGHVQLLSNIGFGLGQ
jgi:hypothetical protein